MRWVRAGAARPAVGRGIRPGRYRLWGATYVRLWTLDLLLAIGPLPVLSGSPLMATYLRLLGARVGAPYHDRDQRRSACPRMLEIGADATVGYGAPLRPWRVEDGWVVVEPITVGAARVRRARTRCSSPVRRSARTPALGEQSVLGPDETVPARRALGGFAARRSRDPDPTVVAMLAAPAAASPGLAARTCSPRVLGVVGLELRARSR